MPKAIKDIYTTVEGLAPAARTASANGTGLDLKNVIENMFVFPCGTRTDGTHTPKLQESSDNSTFTDVAAADQVGSLVAMTSNTYQQVSYIGSLRYVRPVITVAGATTGALTAAHAVVKYRAQN